ncbi:MAG: DUF3418 domain-containing protein, partial [Mycobacteriaceae bacterium]|nr:DUF3418 domain-containing protein [Mycobacteriaceae bacterium]
AVLGAIEIGDEPLLDVLQRELHRRTGVLVPVDAFDLDKVPAHLRLTFAVEAPDGTEVARGKDLRALQDRLADQTRRAVSDALAPSLERSGLRSWPDDLEELPRCVERDGVRGYPGLVDSPVGVDIRVFATEPERDAAMRGGYRRLLRLGAASPVKSLEKKLDPRRRLTLSANPDGSLSALLDDCVDAAVDVLSGPPVWTGTEFAAAQRRVSEGLPNATEAILERVEKVVIELHTVQVGLPADPPPAHAEAVVDMRDQITGLLPRGFVAAAGAAHLGDLARYLTAIRRRLERLPQAPSADRDRMQRVHTLQEAYDDLVGALSPGRAAADDVRDIAWMIQEFRVSLWAQQLGTPKPVSEQRIYRAIDAVLS